MGFSLAKKLSENGHQVTVFSRHKGDLDVLKGVKHVPFDVQKDELPADQILMNFTICISTRKYNLKPFRSLKAEDFRTDFEINVLGAVKSLSKVEKSLRKNPGSSIILFSTVAVGQGMPYHSSVAASKGAIEGMVRSLAAEWAPVVRVNAIAPSLTDTPLASRLLSTEERREQSAERHPLKRVGSPDDIAAMASFLLSEESSWISGQIIGVDGGMAALRI
ncbi:MAG: SDR family oxidoreductase [Saprospiraceae bacterium]